MQVHLPLYPRTAIYNLAAPGTTNYLFSQAVTPTGLKPDEGAVLVRVCVLLGGPSTLILGMSDSGGNVVSGTLNNNTALTANTWNTFEFEARKDYTYDFKLGSNVNVNALFVSEVGGGAS